MKFCVFLGLPVCPPAACCRCTPPCPTAYSTQPLLKRRVVTLNNVWQRIKPSLAITFIKVINPQLTLFATLASNNISVRFLGVGKIYFVISKECRFYKLSCRTLALEGSSVRLLSHVYACLKMIKNQSELRLNIKIDSFTSTAVSRSKHWNLKSRFTKQHIVRFWPLDPDCNL